MVMKRRNLANRGTGAPATRRIHGAHPVAEWLRAQPRQLLAVHYDARMAERLRPLLQLAAAAGIRIETSSDDALAALAGTPRHQGVVAIAGPFPYVPLEDVIARHPRLLVVADQLQDPQNLGAVIRTAAAVGVGALIVPRDGAVPITATVEAAAAGAAAFLPVCRVTNVARTLERLREAGYWSVALVPAGAQDLYAVDLPAPLAVVVGGEAGMRRLVARGCDLSVSIPMTGRVESLNASVAAAVVLYEIVRRWRGPEGVSTEKN